MKLYPIKVGTFKLDGGAMFGVVPKVLWSKLNPPDEQNLCTWALRCMLVDTGIRKILIDCGIGTKQDAKFMSHFQPSAHALEDALSEHHVSKADITDVFLTHLHFDHCGGALEMDAKGNIVPAFPNATYWSCKSHIEWALDPNPRERASFLNENIAPLQQHGVLKYIEEEQGFEWLHGITVRFVYGHTEAMMIPEIPYAGRTVAFCADLLPSAYHVGMPYVMSYDVRPLETLKEKEAFFADAIERDYVLFLEHDPVNECLTLRNDDRGRYVANQFLTLSDLAT